MTHPARVMAVGPDGRDLPITDRALVRAAYRYYSNYWGRDVGRFKAGELAAELELIRTANSEWLEEVSRYRPNKENAA